jgi:hypothetical protein
MAQTVALVLAEPIDGITRPGRYDEGPVIVSGEWVQHPVCRTSP